MITAAPGLFSELADDELHWLRAHAASWWCDASAAYERTRVTAHWHLRNEMKDLHRDVLTELARRRARAAQYPALRAAA